MANFTPTNLVKAQIQFKKSYTEAEMRQKQLPALRMALGNQDILIPGADTVRKREDRAVEANVMSRLVRATSATRTYNHTGNRGDSFVVPITWTTYVDKFSISLKELDNNVFSFEQALGQNILNTQLNIQASIESDDISYLLTQRSQINKGNAYGAVNAGTFAFEVPATQRNRYTAIAKQMMLQNFYRGTYDMIMDPLTFIDGQFYGNQGAGNAVNTLYQYAGVNQVQSTDLTDSNYPGGVSLIMPAGSFANVPWIPVQNRTGQGDYASYNGGFGSMADMTGLPITYAVHGYSQRADTSSQNGNTQDLTMEMELSVDIARVLSPLSNSTNGESVVFEVAQLQ